MKRLLLSLFILPILLFADPSAFHLPAQSIQAPPFYYPPSCHWMTALSAMGDSLEIEDGSVWQTDTFAYSDLFYWRLEDPLQLTQNRQWFSSFQFRLVNLTTGGSIPINLSLGPVLANPNAKFLASLDVHRGEATLTDGSRWEICPRDLALFFQWIFNDCILIGSNSGWESSYDFILINSNMNHFVRARQF